MKKILSLVLVFIMVMSVVSLAGCGKAEALKLGMGISTAIAKATDADGETKGIGEADHTVAAVLVNADGKIVKCALDCAANSVEYTSEGKFVQAEEFKTKYEQKDMYGMKAYGGATKEWYEQADAFAGLVAGKTYDEVKALVAEDGKGNADVTAAGCTIYVSEFLVAIEKAVAAATASEATADDTLKVAVVSTQAGDSKDATDEAEGLNEVDSTFAATVVDADGKIKAMSTDAVQAKFTFDKKGKATTDTKAAVATKKEAGDNYGMAAYGTDLNKDGKVEEWYKQADAFNAACVGKNADEVAALAVETGYGVDSLQTAGCTINIADMVKAAVKAAK